MIRKVEHDEFEAARPQQTPLAAQHVPCDRSSPEEQVLGVKRIWGCVFTSGHPGTTHGFAGRYDQQRIYLLWEDES